MKSCSTCQREFPRTKAWFAPRANSPDGLRGQCRECEGGTFKPWLDVVVPEGSRYCRSGDQCLNPNGAMLPDNETYFHWQSNGTLAPFCKVCRCAQSGEWYQQHKEQHHEVAAANYQRNRSHILQQAKRYREENRQWVLAKKRDYVIRNKEAINAKKRQQYSEHREEMRAAQNAAYPLHRQKRMAYQKQYRAEHPDLVAARKREYAQKNKLRIREYKRRYSAANRQKVLTGQRNYKSRKRNAPGAHTAADIELLYRSQKGLCWWCSDPVGDDYHVDHRIPLSKGGSNAPENLCIACPSCNQRKFNRMYWNGRLL